MENCSYFAHVVTNAKISMDFTTNSHSILEIINKQNNDIVKKEATLGLTIRPFQIEDIISWKDTEDYFYIENLMGLLQCGRAYKQYVIIFLKDFSQLQQIQSEKLLNTILANTTNVNFKESKENWF